MGVGSGEGEAAGVVVGSGVSSRVSVDSTPHAGVIFSISHKNSFTVSAAASTDASADAAPSHAAPMLTPTSLLSEYTAKMSD